jgi:hypothetical protein
MSCARPSARATPPRRAPPPSAAQTLRWKSERSSESYRTGRIMTHELRWATSASQSSKQVIRLGVEGLPQLLVASTSQQVVVAVGVFEHVAEAQGVLVSLFPVLRVARS